jgi:hypothetical protein
VLIDSFAESNAPRCLHVPDSRAGRRCAPARSTSPSPPSPRMSTPSTCVVPLPLEKM